MSTITTILGGDFETNSRTVINTNFSNLNTDKFETSNIDTDTALAANSDTKVASQKAVKTYIDTVGGANASTTVRGVVEEATAAEVTARTAAGGTGARLFVNPGSLGNLIKFGGTGTDGALSITSGTTTIDCANASVVTKNYTSISITGGKLAFSNPNVNGTIIILRSQGAVTITSGTSPAIDASAMGGNGGTGGATNGSAGNNGINGGSTIVVATVFGNGGQGGASPQTGAAGGTRLAIIAPIANIMPLFCGAGAGGGGGSSGSNFTSGGGGGGSAINPGGTATSSSTSGSSPGGNGGRGGGALYIECAGAYNCTSTISVAGGAGTSGNNANAGAGGGGGGGTIIVRYGSLTADSGTYTVTGGAAGATGIAAGAGGDGFSSIATNTYFT